MTELDGLHRHGPVVVLSGVALEPALRAVLIAARQGRLNGVRDSPAYTALATAFTQAMADNGHEHVGSETVVALCISDNSTVTIAEADPRLNRSQRPTRRRATELGGQKIGGRWLLDDDAIRQHEQRTEK